jgi:hypothetical protein
MAISRRHRADNHARDSRGELPDGHPVDAYKRDFPPNFDSCGKQEKISHRFSSFLFLPINRLLGPFNSVIASTKAILVIDHQHFLAEHVRTAFASSESSTRKLFAQSCLGPCLSYIHPGEGYTRSLFSSVQKEFPFEKDLKESDEFAPDLV